MPSDTKLNSIIMKWTSLAGVANMAGVSSCQRKMFYDMAGEFDVKVTREFYREVLATLVAGVGVWALMLFCVTKMIKVFPGIGYVLFFWQPPLVAAFTWAMGHVLKSYFPLVKKGKTLDKKEMKLAMKESWKRAKMVEWKKILNSSK